MSVKVLSPSLAHSERPSWLTSLPRTSSSRSVNTASATKIDISSSPSCITTFPVCRHAARKTWLEIVPSAKDRELRSHSAGPYGNFFAITWPYGKMDRVKLATEIIETLWVYDDLAEDIPHSKAAEVHAKIRDSLEADKVSEQPSRKTVIMGLFHEFSERLVRMDKEGASRVIDSLKSYLQDYDSKKGAFLDINEYTEFRVVNVGFWIMESFMQWALDICLTPAEQEVCHKFCLSAGRAMGLTNDLYSWNVERNDPANRQWNAVPVIKKQYDLTEEDAVVYLKGLIVQHEQKTRQLGLEVRRQCAGSRKMAKYVDAMGMMLGGNCFWSSNCPRYNNEIENE
ncbi:terpenoid synthase [Lentithecium fluviatile CBS 122367]|uniref:Terpene synthase n=1 Tax=Lentithecium fluviatile CBS 122367 TaxID=1168545 RepID=A0A6G1JDY1_9PLEO|nr:terpenoid synthase [Lentithecium fluviatile CBS 122367]